jgi:hypothetical protein
MSCVMNAMNSGFPTVPIEGTNRGVAFRCYRTAGPSSTVKEARPMNRRLASSNNTTTPTTSIDLNSAASEIRDLHKSTQSHARQAVDFAQQAGHLLLAVKATLKHGEFIPWVEQHCNVTARQVQRYMAAAKGRLPPARKLLDGPTRSDTTMSHLPRREEAATTETTS